MKQRNGKIEFMRFVFCIAIVLFHIDKKYFELSYQFNDHVSFFQHGDIGVEFFFLVTGYLFAATCYKKKTLKEPLGKETVCYLYRKWISFFPQYFIAFFATWVAFICVDKLNLVQALRRLFQGIPSFLLLQKTGIYGESMIGEAWYLAAMLVALFILYPLCRKNYDLFTRVIAPVLGICIVGYMYKTFGCITEGAGWGTYFSRPQLRAIAEISLGAFTFEVCRFISKYVLPKSWRIFLTVAEVGCYFSVLVFVCSTLKNKYEPYALIALMVAVCLSFSSQTYGKVIFQNKVVMFLGKLSLPIYLSQTFIRTLVLGYAGHYSNTIQVIMNLAGVVLFALLLNGLGNRFSKKINNTLSAIVENTKHVTA